MSIISKMRRQRAVFWKRGASDHHGVYAYEEPVEIACRWEDGSKEIRNTQGEFITFASTVYVDRELNLGDMLMLGSIESNTPSDPKSLPAASSVKRFEKLPDLKAREFLYTAYL